MQVFSGETSQSTKDLQRAGDRRGGLSYLVRLLALASARKSAHHIVQRSNEILVRKRTSLCQACSHVMCTAAVHRFYANAPAAYSYESRHPHRA